jgi:hypothetical protein
MRALTPLAFVASLTVTFAAAASAQELDAHLYPRFELTASGTLLVLGEDLRIDPGNSPDEGTDIDAEDALGVPRESFQPRATFRWRPGRRQELEVGYLRVVRSSEKVLTDTIAFADTSFAAGLRVNSNIKTSQAFLTYRYAFRVRPQSQIGAAVGLGAIFFGHDLTATAGTTAGGADTTIVPYSADGSFTGPTASIGLYGRFKLSDRWYFDSDLRGLYLKIQNFTARVVELGAAGRYFFSPSLGVELGYQLGFYNVTLDRAPSSGFLGIGVSGAVKYTVSGLHAGVVVPL